MKSRWIAVSLLTSLVALGGTAAAAPDGRKPPELRPAPARVHEPEARTSPSERADKPSDGKRSPLARDGDRPAKADKSKADERHANGAMGKHGKGKPDRAARAERARAHREIANDAIHARRLEKLERMRTAASSEDIETLQRVDKLIVLENARYTKALSKMDARRGSRHDGQS